MAENEAERDKSAHQVARDHDALAVEAVEQHAGERAGQHGGNGAGEHDAGDNRAAVGFFDRQAEDGDVVEVIAHLADDLPCPSETVIAIAEREAARSPTSARLSREFRKRDCLSQMALRVLGQMHEQADDRRWQGAAADRPRCIDRSWIDLPEAVFGTREAIRRPARAKPQGLRSPTTPAARIPFARR